MTGESGVHGDYFVANTPDELHCLQACYAMVVARATGEHLTPEAAETPTAFRPGHRSWPFESILSWARAGLPVRTIDLFDAEAFAEDPVSTVRSWYPNDPAESERMVRESDLQAEASRVRRALTIGHVHFENRVPSFDDLIYLVAKTGPATSVVARVNHRVFTGRPGHFGHFVIVDAVEVDGVRVQDPGPPPRRDHVYPEDLFKRAWMGESGDAGELILVGPDAHLTLP